MEEKKSDFIKLGVNVTRLFYLLESRSNQKGFIFITSPYITNYQAHLHIWVYILYFYNNLKSDFSF